MVRPATHTAMRYSIKRKEIESTNHKKRREKVLKGKSKPLTQEDIFANLLVRSKSDIRKKQYAKLKILPVTGAPYWPPLTPKTIKLIKAKVPFEYDGFSFTSLDSHNGRISFSTTIKIGEKTFTKTKVFFEIDFRQRTIRFAPEWKKIEQLKKSNPEEARLLSLGERRL